MSDVDLDQLMRDAFGSAKQDQEEQKFYLWYNAFGKILGFSSAMQEEFKDELYAFISKEKFIELQDVNLNNFIVDKDKDPVELVDISSDGARQNSKLHKIDPTLWNDDRLITLVFDKQTRNLRIKVKNQLPTKRRMWIVPKGNYMIPLADIELFAGIDEDYHIKEYKDITSCEVITEADLNIFVAYKEI
jgi:hypothetical protein